MSIMLHSVSIVTQTQRKRIPAAISDMCEVWTHLKYLSMLMRTVESSVTHNVINQLLVLLCRQTRTYYIGPGCYDQNVFYTFANVNLRNSVTFTINLLTSNTHLTSAFPPENLSISTIRLSVLFLFPSFPYVTLWPKSINGPSTKF